MSGFNNVQTADDYSPAATVANVPNGVQVSLHVFNEAVRYQLASGYPSGAWGAEHFLAPGFHVLARKASGVRVRSAVAGSPAQVTAEIVDESEVSWGDTPPGDFHGMHTLTVDVDGNPTFEFDGFVHAQGLVLDAHEGGADPLPHSTIRWVREADGNVVAQAHAVYGQQGATNERFELVTHEGNARLRLDGLGANDGGAKVRVSAAFSGLRTLIDQDEASDFVQLADGPAIVRLRLVTVAHDPASIAAGGLGVEDVALGADTMSVGDRFALLGVTSLPNAVVVQRAHGICLADDTARVYLRNLAAGASDPNSGDYHFAIFNES